MQFPLLLELTIDLETTKNKCSKQKQYDEVKFVDLSINVFGVCDPLTFTRADKYEIRQYKQNSGNILIRASCYIICKRNEEWANPELMYF